MYKLFLVPLCALLLAPSLQAQQMQWVIGNQVDNPEYVDRTDCKTNLLCYALAYTPDHAGVLTSYTTNFLVDCDAGGTAVVSNASLVMTDKSNQLEACAEAGILLLNSSGNSGATDVKAGRPTYLHEICLRTSSKSTSLQFSTDEASGLTMSLDIFNAGPVTERPVFTPLFFKRNQTDCSGQRL